jgi:hypothetical protein
MKHEVTEEWFGWFGTLKERKKRETNRSSFFFLIDRFAVPFF